MSRSGYIHVQRDTAPTKSPKSLHNYVKMEGFCDIKSQQNPEIRVKIVKIILGEKHEN